MGGGKTQTHDQVGQVGCVLFGAALAEGALALAVAPAVVGEDAEAAEAAGEGGHDKVPSGVVAPRAVNEHERRAGVAGHRVEETDSVGGGGWHGPSPT